MSDQNVQAVESTEGMAKIVYILYMVGIVIGLTSVVGVIMAYIYKDNAPAWMQSHYQFQIRTFWIGILYFVVGFILSFIGIGVLILLFWAIWIIVRCVKGIQVLDRKEPHPNPTGWMFS